MIPLVNFVFSAAAFGISDQYLPVLEDLRVVHHILKACRTDPFKVMPECLFYPHVRPNHDFLRMTLPFQVNLHNSNFAVGFTCYNDFKDTHKAPGQMYSIMCDLRGDYSGASFKEGWNKPPAEPGVNYSQTVAKSANVSKNTQL